MRLLTIIISIVVVLVPTIVITVWILSMGLTALLPTIPFWGKLLVGIILAGPVAGIVAIPFYFLTVGVLGLWTWFEARKSMAAMREEIKKH